MVLTTLAPAYGADWRIILSNAKQPVERSYAVAAYWSWREYCRWHDSFNYNTYKMELKIVWDYAIKFDAENKTLIKAVEEALRD